MVYYLWTHCNIESIHNALLFSERMFLVVHVMFLWLSENARSFHLRQANISLCSEKVQNDLFLRSLEKSHGLFLLLSDNLLNATK